MTYAQSQQIFIAIKAQLSFLLALTNFLAYLTMLLFKHLDLWLVVSWGILYILLTLIPIFIRQYKDLKRKRVRVDPLICDVIALFPSLVFLACGLYFFPSSPINISAAYLLTGIIYSLNFILSAPRISTWVRWLVAVPVVVACFFYCILINPCNAIYIMVALGSYALILGDLKMISTSAYFVDYPLNQGKVRLSYYLYFFNLLTASLSYLVGSITGSLLGRIGDIYSADNTMQKDDFRKTQLGHSIYFDLEDAGLIPPHDQMEELTHHDDSKTDRQ